MATTPPYNLKTTHAAGDPGFVDTINELAGAVNDAGNRVLGARRNVASLLVNGWTAAVLVLLRYGNTCTLIGNGVNGSAATNNVLATLPVGYRMTGLANAPIDAPMGGVNLAAGVPFPRVRLSTDTGNVSTAERQTNMNFALTWVTSDSWPTTLPGTTA